MKYVERRRNLRCHILSHNTFSLSTPLSSDTIVHLIKKRLCTFMFALACALAVPTAAVLLPTTEAYAAETVTITNIKNRIDVSKKIHQALMEGKKVVVSQYKCGPIRSMDQFRTTVAKINGCGVKFKYTTKRKSYPKNYKDKYLAGTGYSVFTISEANARAYRDEVNALTSGVSDAVNAASESLARQIHDSIYAMQPFTFYTKGKPDAICNDLKQMIKPINRQGVIFKYSSKKVPGSDCYQVTIDKGQAEAYYYAVNLMMLVAKGMDVGSGYTEETSPALQVSNAQQILYDASCMNDVSDIVKLYAISSTAVFRGGNMNYVEKDAGRYWYGASDQQILKELYEYKAKGTCGDYAKAEEVLFSYLDIDVKFCTSDRDAAVVHAWTEGRAANSDGMMVDYKFDYELETRDNNNQGEFSKGENLLTY